MGLFELLIDYDHSPPDIGDRDVCCHLSGGAGSAVAAMRCVEWYGRDRVHLVFADTNSESEGNYALVDAVERETGIEVVRLNQGKNIWDVFDEHGVMRIIKTGACKASVELKQKPLDQFTRSRFSLDEVVIATGLSYEERRDRQVRLQNKLSPYTCFFPLNVRPCLSACEIVEELGNYKLPVSEQYRQGYQHDNCKAGAFLLD